MTFIEKSGKTVEDAVQAGLKELGKDTADVNIEVLEYGSPGLLGLFGKNAKVRLTVKEDEPDFDMPTFSLDQPTEKKSGKSQKKQDKKAKSEDQSKQQTKDSSPSQATKAAPVQDTSPAAGKAAVASKAAANAAETASSISSALASSATSTTSTTAPTFTSTKASTSSASSQPLSSNVSASKGQRNEAEKSGQTGSEPAKSVSIYDAVNDSNDEPQEEYAILPERKSLNLSDDRYQEHSGRNSHRRRATGNNRAKSSETETKKPVVSAPAEDLPPLDLDSLSAEAQEGYKFLVELTRLMGVDVEIRMQEGEDQLNVQIIGDTLGVLIGRRGETLDAIQYLTSLKLNKGRENYLRVTLDSEHYRAKREEALTRLAERMANRARRSGHKVSLEPMNPYERRILHSALQNNPYVTTHSEGDEPYRHVIITLK